MSANLEVLTDDGVLVGRVDLSPAQLTGLLETKKLSYPVEFVAGVAGRATRVRLVIDGSFGMGVVATPGQLVVVTTMQLIMGRA